MDEPLDEPPAAPLGGLQTDFAELRQAWINEKAAPEILQCVHCTDACARRSPRPWALRTRCSGSQVQA